MGSCRQRRSLFELLVGFVFYFPVQVSLDAVVIVVVFEEAPHDIISHDLGRVDLEFSSANHILDLVGLSGLQAGHP